MKGRTVPGSGALLLAAIFVGTVSGQVATGVPPFGSFSGGPDGVNNANLNVHWEVPIFSRAGRGLPFSYALSYDSAVWNPASGAWVPAANWGWNSITQAELGYLVVPPGVPLRCGDGIRIPITSWYAWTGGFQYIDPSGVAHTLNGAISTWPPGSSCGGGPPSQAVLAAGDGSGYMMNASASQSNLYLSPLMDRSGSAIHAPTGPGPGSGSVTDTNGNQISVTTGSTASFYDTLSSGVPALTVSGAATTASPTVFSYTNPSGGTSSYRVNYTNYSVRTHFGCSGVAEYSSGSQPLVSSIGLPDGTSYSFTYETTPGYAGSVTGRLQSVTVPAGGTISYGYAGGNDGITCTDGSTATLARTTPDGTWTYVHSESGTGWSTTITDPQNNQTAMQFQGIYETQRKVYQGSASGTLLQTVDTCYNGSASPCTGLTLPPSFTQISTVTSLPGPAGLQAKTASFYNSYGLSTEVDQYDFGSGGPGALIRKSVTTYNTPLTNGIVDRPSTVQVFNGSGTLIAQTSYLYDEGAVTATSGTPQHIAVSGSRGNVTTVQQLVSGGTSLVQHYSYYDTGNVNVSTDTNNAQTTYSYGNCGNSFPSGVAMPLSLSTSQAWNCSGAVATSATDANGKSGSVSFADPNLWRPTSVTDATGAVTALSYFTSPNSGSESALNFNGATSTADSRTTLDGLGRTRVTQQKQAQGSNNYDSVETDYDALGRVSRVTVPYTGVAGQLNAGAPATTTTYDALSRPLTVTDGGGGSTSYSYAQNDVLVTVGPAPAGENTKRRQLEYDRLGRLKSVCEITAAAGSGSCGQTTAQTGFLTRYTYDAQGNLVTAVQNAQSSSTQTRTYNYDGLGRMLSETNPETNGTASSYTYDSDATCGTSAGDQVKRVDPAGNVTCYAYDALHRNTAVTYPSGPYAAATAERHFVYEAATVNGSIMANAKGRLAEAYTGPAIGKITDLGFSYSARGETTDTYESTPHSGGYFHISGSYWANGLPNSLNSNIAGVPNWTYSADGEGRLNTVSASSGQNPVTGTTYNNSGQTASVNFGSLDSDTFTYDSNTGRMLSYSFNVNGLSDVGTLVWNANGTLQQFAIDDSLNLQYSTSDTQSCANVYDDLMRLVSNNCGTKWAQSFSYDVFGNIAIAGTYSFQPTYDLSSNRYKTVPGTVPAGSPAYDSDGNVLRDGSGLFDRFSWDAEGRNTYVSPSPLIIYDALGRWVEQPSSGGSGKQQVFALDGSRLAQIVNGQFSHVYLRLPGGAVARYSPSQPTAVLDYYLHADWLGSTRLLSTPARTAAGIVAVSPFGDYHGTSNIDSFFTGVARVADEGAGDLLTFPARNYQPGEGRWLAPDPAGLTAVDLTNPQTWNRYAYVNNNPLALVDPTGMYIGTGGGGGGGTGAPGGPAYAGIFQNCVATQQALIDQTPGSSYQQRRSPAQTCAGINQLAPAPNFGSGGGSSPTPPNTETAPNNQIAANINDLIVFAGHGKGERNYTAKPDKPLKGVRPVVKGGKVVGWTIPSPDGKRIPKSLDWGKANGLNESDPKWLAIGMLAGAGAGAAADALVGLEGWELLVGAGALAF